MDQPHINTNSAKKLSHNPWVTITIQDCLLSTFNSGSLFCFVRQDIFKKLNSFACLMQPSTLLKDLILLQATTTCLPTWRTGCDHGASTIMTSWQKEPKCGWAHRQQTSLTEAYKNLFPNITSASIPAVTTLRSNLSTYFFVYNKIFLFSLLVLLTAHQRLLSK
jgi:hypothetical protein